MSETEMFPKSSRAIREGIEEALDFMGGETKRAEPTPLIDRFSEIIETGAKRMDTEQLRDSEKKFNDAIDRAVANKRRRETAMQHDLLLAIKASECEVSAIRDWATRYGIDLGKATNSQVLYVAVGAAIARARGQE